MRFVAVKTPGQQSVMMLHRVRLMLNRQRTQLSNAMRAHMSEFGIVAPVGRLGLERLLTIIADRDDESLPGDARLCLEMLGAQLAVVRSEEHTSELQSLMRISYAVFCLKKKKH